MTDFLKSNWKRLSASARITILPAVSLAASVFLIFAGRASSQSSGALDANGTQSFSTNEMYISLGNTNFVSGDYMENDNWVEWGMYCYKVGGEWSTNEDRSCWRVAAEETNAASLRIELERMVLPPTSDVLMEVSFFDATNSALYVDLYDEDENVLAEDLFGNLMTGSNVDTTVLLDIPLASFPDAIGISLRRGSGEITIYESLLYVTNQNLDAEQSGGADLVGNNNLVPRIWAAPVDSGTIATPASDASNTSSGFTATQETSMGGGMGPMMLGAGSGSYGNWNYEMAITFPGYNKAETLTNFPVLVMLSTNLSGFAYSQPASPNGYDLRFSASDQTTELNYEIEKWNTNDTSYVWVQIPGLASDTQIWAYWGNTDSSVTSSPAIYTTNGATWSQGFAAVWHLAANSPNVTDSTSNKYSSTSLSSTNVAGIADGAQGFDGYKNIAFGNPSGLQISAGTMEAWINTTTPGNSFRGILTKQSAYGMFLDSGVLVMFDWGSSVERSSGAYLADTKWHHVAVTFKNATAGGTVFYVDGVSKAVTDFGTIPSQGQDVHIGDGGQNQGQVINGLIDETRISGAYRSSNWIWACWLNIASNSVFNSYGEIQGETQGPPIIGDDGGASNIAITAATLNGNLTSTGGAPTTVYVYWGTTDGGTDPGSWANSSNLGSQASGPVSCNVTGLVGETEFYYRFYATNSYGDAWAGESTSFTTLLDPNSYLYKLNISFPGYSKAETLTNFPALVALSTNLSGFLYSQFGAANGYELRFMDSDQTTELNYEFDNWDTGNTSYIWVQIPALTSNTSVWAFWGNSSSCVTSAPAFYTTNGATWSQGYAAVWHLDETPTGAAGEISDSAANNNDGTTVGGMGSGNSVAGRVDRALNFNGSGQRVGYGDPNSLQLSTGTIEAWVNTANSGYSYRGILTKQNAYGMFLDTGVFVIYDWSASAERSSGISLADSQWHHVAATFNSGVVGGTALYVDGVKKLTTQMTVLNQSVEVQIADGHSAQYLNGAIDEARISSSYRSSNWIWACWLNVASNSTFTSYGSLGYTSRDENNNGIPDGWEMRYFGNLNYGANDDPDGDGFSNIYEYLHGTNPNDPQSKPAGTRFVSPSGSDTPPYTSWATAANSIKAALSVASNPYEIIMVADGVYTGDTNSNIRFPSNPVMLTSTSGPANCIIDGGGANQGFVIADGQGIQSVINSMTIRNCAANYGAGISCQTSSPTILNCVITSNTAAYDGGGIDLSGSSPLIKGCVICNNTATGHGGGGISCWSGSQPLMQQCTIAGNTAAHGGGAYVYGIVMTGSNEFTDACSPVFRNCLFSGNTSSGNGGGVLVTPGGEPLLENCTVAGNSANDGGGIYSGDGTNFNGIVYFNTAATNANWGGYGFGMSYYNSCTTPLDNLSGAGNIADDPSFISSGNYRLASGSPCVDAGTNQDWMTGAKDLDGNPRIVNGTVDMGAYERQ